MRARRLALAARLLAGFQRRDAVLADAPRAPLLDLGGLRGDVVAPLEALVARVVEPGRVVGAAVGADAAAVAAIARLRGDEEIYEACARAAGDALPRVVQALAGAPSLDDGEAPSLEVDDVDPWLSLSAYLGNVAEEFIS